MTGVDFISVPPAPNPYRYWYTNECPDNYNVRIADRCVDGIIPPPSELCEQGVMAMPRWARLLDDGTGLPGPWILEAGYSCPGGDDYPFAFDDFAILPIESSPIELQPGNGWVYAGLETVAFTDAAPQGFQVTLRGGTFFVGALPVEYSWDFGDGAEPVVTTEPGQPWPDHTVSHIYRSQGVASPTLTTQWKGVFKTSQTGPWLEIPGTGETTTNGPSITVHTARTRLVEDPLD